MSPPAIHIDRLRKAYRRHLAVDDVSLDVEPGEIFGLVGPNGAGKTTTMECVEGIRTADRGAITVLGLDPVRDVYALQERIGVQLQQAQLQKRIRVSEAVHLWASLYRKPSRSGDVLLDQLGLSDKRDAWFMTLSGGQKQRLFIALALINDPEVVFFDELTTGLDPQARRAIWELVRDIRARGRTVFLTTHLMEEAERLCDRVAIIEHGRLVDVGPPAALVARHCPDRAVVLVTEDADAATGLQRVPHLVSLAREGTRFTLHGTGENFVSAVIACLSDRHIRVTDFRTVLPTLEDVFLALTGRSIRDEAIAMRGLWQLTWLEIRIYLREPLGVIGSLIPVVAFVVIARLMPAGARQATSVQPATGMLGPGAVPVLLSLLIAVSAVLSLVTIIAIYREGGILKRLRATPLRPATILTAHVLAKLLLTAVTIALLLLAGKRYVEFGAGVPVVRFGVALVLSACSILSLGFVIASLVPTARFAQPVGALLLYPMIGLSGLFVPVASYPPVLGAVARALPFTYVVSLLLGIWRGDGWSVHAGDLAALAITFGAGLLISARVFRWE